MGESAGDRREPLDPPLRVVVVHWNQPAACAETVERFLRDPVPVRITVVDNASSPAARSELHARLGALDAGDAVEVIESPVNSGFGPGANLGLRAFLDRPDDGDWVALCPHDVELFPGCLTASIRTVGTEPMAGLACADVGDGMVPVIDPYFGGMTVPSPTPPPPEGSTAWEDVAYPHGTLMFLRRACLDDVGVFDERYFSYCEEADLARRAAASGWRIGLIRNARVQNLHLGSSVALVDYLQTRNTILFVRELSGTYHAVIRTCITLMQVVSGLLRPASRPLVFDARARLLGVRDVVRRRFGPPPRSVLPRQS